MPTRDYQLSQHFLRSPRLALKLIGHSNLKKRDLVLDIGAGSGVITIALAKRVREVWAIEPDRATAKKLRANLAKYHIENVRVFEQDFMTLDLPTVAYKVFANPPFHLPADKTEHPQVQLKPTVNNVRSSAGPDHFPLFSYGTWDFKDLI